MTIPRLKLIFLSVLSYLPFVFKLTNWIFQALVIIQLIKSNSIKKLESNTNQIKLRPNRLAQIAQKIELG